MQKPNFSSGMAVRFRNSLAERTNRTKLRVTMSLVRKRAAKRRSGDAVPQRRSMYTWKMALEWSGSWWHTVATASNFVAQPNTVNERAYVSTLIRREQEQERSSGPQASRVASIEGTKATIKLLHETSVLSILSGYQARLRLTSAILDEP